MANENGVTVDESTINNCINTITEESIRESVNTMVKPSVDELKKSAQNFLSQSLSLEGRIEDIENTLEIQQKIRHQMDKSEYSILDSYVENQKKIRTFLNGSELSKLWTLTADFQDCVNRFIGQKVEMVYVFVDSDDTPILYEMENENILHGDYSRTNQVVARYRANHKNFENDLRRIVLNDKEYDMVGVANATSTYQEIMERYRSHTRTQRVMWLNPSPPVKWHLTKIYQVGDINEAYSNIILSHQESLFSQTNVLDTNIELFMVLFFTQVDTVSGLLQGDIEYNNIEYGIKSAKASMLSLNEVQSLAELIMNTENITEDTIKQEKARLESEGSTRNAIYKRVQGRLVELPLDELVRSLQAIGLNVSVS